MLTCKEASLLASKQMDVKLTWRERIALRLHIGLCDMCGRYVKDLKKLRMFLKKTGASSDALASLDTYKLSEQDRGRIQQALHAECHTDEHSEN
ncbi:hypothetical protein MCAMS1_00289 [biofilm metagenome]